MRKEDKIHIVKAEPSRGKLVAMTVEEINDAPTVSRCWPHDE
jgi:high-affinity K+ transport system ATPase subunit B